MTATGSASHSAVFKDLVRNIYAAKEFAGISAVHPLADVTERTKVVSWSPGSDIRIL
jgi:hypothetical protein